MAKNFAFYFEEAMATTLVPKSLWPTGWFESTWKAAAAISACTSAAKMIGANATVAELLSVVSVGGGPGGAGAKAMIAGGTAKAASGVLAAYWVGCCIGAVVYAAQMLTVGDSWMDEIASVDANVLANVAKKNGIEVPNTIVSLIINGRAVQSSRTAIA